MTRVAGSTADGDQIRSVRPRRRRGYHSGKKRAPGRLRIGGFMVGVGIGHSRASDPNLGLRLRNDAAELERFGTGTLAGVAAAKWNRPVVRVQGSGLDLVKRCVQSMDVFVQGMGRPVPGIGGKLPLRVARRP